jgi:hypothetical protein
MSDGGEFKLCHGESLSNTIGGLNCEPQRLYERDSFGCVNGFLASSASVASFSVRLIHY